MTTEQMIEEATEKAESILSEYFPVLIREDITDDEWFSVWDELKERIASHTKSELHLIATKSAEDAVEEIDALIEESGGVYGLHMNGEPATWEWLINNGWLEKTGKLLPQPKDTNE